MVIQTFIDRLLRRQGPDAVTRATMQHAELRHQWVLLCFDGVKGEPYHVHPFIYRDDKRAVEQARGWVAKRLEDVHDMHPTMATACVYIQAHKGQFIVGDDSGEFHVIITPVVLALD